MAIRLSTHEMDETGNANFNHHTTTNAIGDGNQIGQQSGTSQKSPHWIPTFKEAPSPKTISSIVRRIRALILCLLPVEVEEDSIKGQEGILDQNVVLSFSQVAGDFGSIIPFALLMARKSFVNDAKDSEYTLNSLRALACEVLARRVVARAHKLYIEGKIRPSYRHPTEHCLVERFICYEQGGEVYYDQEEGGGSLTSPKNALELAVDQQLIIFLSSSSVQHVVEDIWKGRIVRVYKPDGTYRFVSSIVGQSPSFLSHFGDTSRLAVPRNYYFLQVFIWIIFISIYTLVTRSYGDGTLDLPEFLLWIFIASYLLEDVQRWIRQKSMDYFTLWNILDLATDVLYLISFGLRIYGWLIPDYEDGRNDSLKEALHLKSFQFLSLLAPLLWFQLLKAFDVVQFFGIVMIVMTRMLGEAGTFAVLLIVNSVGFGQALFSLDLSDPDQGIRHPTRVLLETFAKSVIGVVDFNLTSQNFGYPFGQILFYISAFVSRLLLATILTALFSTAYATVQKDSKTIFSSYFAEKVIGLIKNPDQHVYLPPINLLEVFLISPLEFILPRRAYSKLNNFLQYCFFALPLGLIALYEVRVDYREKKKEALKDRPKDRDRIEASDQRSGGSVENPEVGDGEGNKGLVISRVKFEDLVKRLPDVQANDEDLKHLTGDETPDADETLIPNLTPSSSGNLKTSATATSATSSPDPSKEPSMDEILTELLKLRSENVSNDTILKGLKGLAKK